MDTSGTKSASNAVSLKIASSGKVDESLRDFVFASDLAPSLVTYIASHAGSQILT